MFTGTDGGLYSELPQITGMQYYQAIDDQWQLIRDEGQMRAQYAKDLSSTVDGIVIAETTIIEGALSGMAEAGLRSVAFRQGARATLNVAGETAEGAQVAANTGAKLSSNGVKLAKQLASEAQMAEKGITLIGPGKLKEAARLARQYGGKAGDWVKKSSSSFKKNGTTIETHWYENISSGARVEFKTKFP